MNRRHFVGGIMGTWVRPHVEVRNTQLPPPFSRGSLVAVQLDGHLMVGEIGEKVAGGLYEIIFTVNDTPHSGVFRMDEMLSVSGQPLVHRGME